MSEMTNRDVDTKISQLLDWTMVGLSVWTTLNGNIRGSINFSGDLNLVHKEATRQGLTIEIEALVTDGWVEHCVNFRCRTTGVRYPSIIGENLYETAALAFLRLLESKKEENSA